MAHSNTIQTHYDAMAISKRKVRDNSILDFLPHTSPYNPNPSQNASRENIILGTKTHPLPSFKNVFPNKS
jgi:hypothetical protein